MTEPEVAGSDPTLLRTRAVLDGDEWVIDGHKWFSSGADGAVVRDRVRDHRPGCRAAPAGHDDPRPVRHAGRRGRARRAGARARRPRLEHALRGALHGRSGAGRERARRVGEAFRLAQKRLGPGRIHHVMRWLGQMQRAFELMCSLRARARGVRRAARRQADRAELDRRLGRRDPGVPTADDGRRAEDRRGLRGAGRGLAAEVLRRRRAERGDRPRRPGARRARADRRDAARADGAARPRGADLRRAGRGAPRWSSRGGSCGRSATATGGRSRSSQQVCAGLRIDRVTGRSAPRCQTPFSVKGKACWH